ncbi:hypothetical protein IE988_24050 [Klebsiella pneumoniae]|uniref:Uncharacterized protein n=1 Tax=Klebsiella pneumoniae TaxID=573 RepID=A0A927HSH4_KLEPN|nr:hypothetical protein [Klebsiella pneumoniae]
MLTEERAGEKRYRWLLRRRNNKAGRKASALFRNEAVPYSTFRPMSDKSRGCYQELDGRHLFVRHSKFM